MNVTTAYKIMELDESATLENLKKQYRHLAFQYHPDLNQNDPQAAKKFQQVNEAYILLQDEIAKGTSRKFTARTRRKPAASQNQERKTQAKPQNPFQQTTQTTQTEQKQQAQQKREEVRREEVKRERHERQEKIFKDILKDPFAKKVYEDIFLKLKEGKAKYSPVSRDVVSDDSRPGPLTRVKSWLHKRADIWETVHVAAKKLIPGNVIKVTISHPLTGSPLMLDVRLPYDFSVGRTLRLRKKGKNLGLWKGDLYLRFLPK